MKRIPRDRLQAPALVLDWDMAARPGTTSVDVASYNSLWVLVRNGPAILDLSFWEVAGDVTITLAQILPSSSPSPSPVAPPGGEADPGSTRSLQAHRPGSLTVAVCTHQRTRSLLRLLESLRRQSDPDFDVLIVDSAPLDTSLKERLADFPDLPLRYAIQPARGLSRARNTALALIDATHVAWIDDDEVASSHWIANIKLGFAHPSKPAAVCGFMFPAELVTDAQVRFEQFDGFNKGKPLSPLVLSRDNTNPLYPMPGFGAGGNMAFRTSAVRSAGGFDPYLGAGTRTHGGEETRTLSYLLASGERVLHWPPAFTWHYHRADERALAHQMFGYSAGLSAFYLSFLLKGPWIFSDILRLFSPRYPGFLNQLIGRQRSVTRFPADFPEELIHRSRLGLLAGGPNYVRELLADHIGRL